jgi:hypothetical protein
MSDKKQKVITLPVSGSMALPKHSKKLEWRVRDFITSLNGHYYDDEIDKGILKSYFKLDNGILLEQEIRIRQEDYLCYTTLSCHANPEDKNIIFCWIRKANALNLELDYGSFEVNEDTGDIRFRTYYKPESVIDMESIDMLLGYPKHIINKYGHVFLEK